jgi:hypothetical protein
MLCLVTERNQVLQKLIVARLVKVFNEFYWAAKFINVFTIFHLWSQSRARYIQSETCTIISGDETPCNEFRVNRYFWAASLLGLFYLEDGGGMFLRNIGWHSTDYKASLWSLRNLNPLFSLSCRDIPIFTLSIKGFHPQGCSPGNVGPPGTSARRVNILGTFFSKHHFICNLYIYIQQIGVRIGCYGLGKGSH